MFGIFIDDATDSSHGGDGGLLVILKSLREGIQRSDKNIDLIPITNLPPKTFSQQPFAFVDTFPSPRGILAGKGTKEVTSREVKRFEEPDPQSIRVLKNPPRLFSK